MQSPGRRLLSIGLAAVLVALAFAGCESGSAKAGAPPEVLAHGPTEAVDGFARMTVPISDRRDAVVVAAGNYIVVYGGFVIDGPTKRVLLRPIDDGVVFDLTTGEWTALPDAPFDAPLYHPAGVWTGADVVITGIPCRSTDPDSENSQCDPGGRVIAAYSPSTRQWRDVEVPEALGQGEYQQSVPIDIGVTGAVDGRAIFAVRGAEWMSTDLVIVDPQTDRAQKVRVPDAGIDKLCVTGEKLIAAHTGDSNPGPILTFELDTATMQWKQLPDAMRSTVAPALFIGQPICTAGQLVYFPILQPPVGLDAGALWYRPEQQRWEPLPRFGSLGFSLLEPMQVGGTRSLWDGPGEALFLLTDDATDWIRVRRPPGAAQVVGALDHSILMDTTLDPRPKGPTTVALFDPNAFLANPPR